MVNCLERGADLHMAQLMPLPLTVCCFSKIQIGFTFWYRLTWVVPDKGLLNWCVCVYISLKLPYQNKYKLTLGLQCRSLTRCWQHHPWLCCTRSFFMSETNWWIREQNEAARPRPRLPFRRLIKHQTSAVYISLIKGKGSPYSITEHRVPELIPVLGS